MTDLSWQVKLPGIDNRAKSIVSLPTSAIVHSSLNPRRTRPQSDIDSLAERIGRNGYEITRAVWVHAVNGHHEVFAGGTRLEAAKRAGIEEIPVVLHEGFTEEEICRLADLDNENDEYHHPVSIVDVWLSYKALADAGWKQDRIGRAKGCKQQHVSARLKYATLPAAVLARFTQTPSYTESIAAELTGLHNLCNLAPWLTREAAMLEVIDKVAIGTAADFAKKVAEYNRVIKAAQDFADSLAEPTRSRFLNALADKKTRTLAGVKDIASKITYEIATAKRLAEEEAQIALQEAERSRIEAERKERDAQKRDLWFAKNVRLIHGDITHAGADIADDSVDLIFTDPPYNESAIKSYGDLALLAARVLKPGGSLITYAGHYALPEIFPLMTPHLRYWWILALQHGGGNARLIGKNVFVEWKPLLWFVKERRRDNEYVADMFKSKQPDKKLHEWQQDTSEAAYYIEHLTCVDDTVLDPFCGSGTTALAAVSLGRRSIVIDLDLAAIETTRERMDEYYSRLG